MEIWSRGDCKLPWRHNYKVPPTKCDLIDLQVDDARVKHRAVNVIVLTDEVRSEMVTVLVFMFSKKGQLFLAVYTTTAVLSAYLK